MVKIYEVEVKDIVRDAEITRYVMADSIGKVLESVAKVYPPPNFEIVYVEMRGKML